MKSAIKGFVALLLVLGMAAPALAADFEFHGDLNNRFNLFTNQAGLYAKAGSLEKATAPTPVLDDNSNESAVWGDIKYRMWTTASTNDGAVKGVYAIEVGAIRFGQNYSKGGGGTYSGDGVNIETRWAYTDLQIPGTQARVSIGLQPFNVNSFVWNETVMGVQVKGDAGPAAYTLAWVRGHEDQFTTGNSFDDADALLARADLKPAEGTKLGLFVLYQHQDAADGSTFTAANNEIKNFGNYQYGIYTLGTDGSFTTPTDAGNFFVNWDAIYQGGKINRPGDLDVSAFLIHADAGINLGKTKLTYTGWYASGDDNSTDGDVKNFMSTDVDRFDSVVLFEGGYTDDNYGTEAPYLLDKGLVLNKLAVDQKLSDTTKVGGALLYLMTAEDLANGDNTLGTEIDAYVSHKLYPNVEVALNAGYLFSDDGMDNFSATGNADDIYRITSRIRYSF